MSEDNNKKGSNIGKKAANAAKAAHVARMVKNKGASIAAKKLAAVFIAKFIAIFLIFSVVLMPILFLFALPTMMYETVMSFVEHVKDLFGNVAWEMEHGVNFLSAIKNLGKNIFEETVVSWWNSFKNWITGTNDRSYDEIDQEGLSGDGNETKITQEEAAQKATLMDCLRATQEAYTRRTDEMKEEISDNEDDVYSTVNSAARSLYNSSYGSKPQWSDMNGGTSRHPYESYEAAVEDTSQTFYAYGGVSISVNVAKLSDMDAARIMSINTVAKGASLQDMHLSDYQKWLGYNPHAHYFWPWSQAAKNSKTVLDIGMGDDNPKLDKWIGTCLPQYLQDQVNYEIDTFGEPTSKGYPDQACAAMDLCIVVNATEISKMPGSERTEEVSVERYFYAYFDEDGNMLTGDAAPSNLSASPNGQGIMVQPLKQVIGPEVGGGSSSGSTPPPASSLPQEPEPTPKPEKQKTSQEFTSSVVYVTYTFSVSIKPRDPVEVLDVLGFVGTENAMDVQPAGGHTGLFSQPAVGESETPPTITPEPTINPDEMPQEVAPDITPPPEEGGEGEEPPPANESAEALFKYDSVA